MYGNALQYENKGPALLVPTGVVTVTRTFDSDPDGVHAVSLVELITFTGVADRTTLEAVLTTKLTLVAPLINPVPVTVIGVVEPHAAVPLATLATVGGDAP